ncbi:MAG: alanine--tRNA ligase [Coriobacteriales bacterium]
MKSSEIREEYLKFFESKGCKRMPSSSLIPDDPSMLLTSAGMVQFKPYFLQQKQLDPAYIGATTCQKCLRTSDIENIGVTGRHLSFFEMLGNFSFGRYFKKEMCAWAYEFTRDVLKFPMEKIYFSVYEEDEETVEIWKSIGVPEDHIVRLGADDNFWLAGETGPCGPCSELYYDQGEEYGCGRPDCAPGCDCDRYIEFWNCVFTQYDRQEDGSMVPLPYKNIDTGMGLERVAALSQGKPTNYESDILWSLIQLAEQLSGKKYGESKRDDMAMRIIADHSRAVTFMIADGILPSNEGRGYVLRRLLRRAVRYGHLLGIEGAFLQKFVDEVENLMGHAYPEVQENMGLIKGVVAAEEERFLQTLARGEEFLADAISMLDGKVLPGDVAFTLHDTYGFPIDITIEICKEQGIDVDEEEFGKLMEEQRERARSHIKGDAWGMYGGVYADIAKQIEPTVFDGYEKNESEGKVLAIVSNGEQVSTVTAPANDVEVFLDKTSFYGEMGGQVGDTGTLESDGMRFEVTDATYPEKGIISHKGNLASGTIKLGDTVATKIDVPRRERIRRNHTATHILHYALRKVLGDHVKQAGSLVAPNRLRFDFTHFEAMTPEQVEEVERIVNQLIMENHPVGYYETTLDDARQKGVTALFGEKYGDIVRVVECGEFSKELCGGTHVRATSEIGLLKIVSESSVGSNTRRIEAVTSFDAYDYVNSRLAVLDEAASVLKVQPAKVAERVAADAAKIREIEKAAKKREKAASGDAIERALVSKTAVEAPYPLEFAKFDGANMNQLKSYWDGLKTKAGGAYALVCASKSGDGAMLIAAGNDAAVEAGFDAGKVIKEIAPLVNGRGGGKPKMAQAGGKDASGIDKIEDTLARIFG